MGKFLFPCVITKIIMAHNLAHEMKVIKESKLSLKSIMAKNGMKYEDDIIDKLLNVKTSFQSSHS